jgi:ferredoxin
MVTTMGWKIDVDAGSCIASGMCAALAPATFTLNGPHAVATAGEVEPDEVLLDAADSCPAAAITITEAGAEIGPRP